MSCAALSWKEGAIWGNGVAELVWVLYVFHSDVEEISGERGDEKGKRDLMMLT